MADEDIDSLLEAGIRAAVQAKQEAATDATQPDTEPNKDGDDTDKKTRRRSSRSRSRSRSPRRSRRDRSRSRSGSRNSRRRSSRRSRRRSRRSRSRSRDRDRERGSRRRRSRSRSKSRSRSPPRERSTSAERAERAKQRELMELTRDHRTVFVGQLTQKVREKDLERFFRQLGKIENVLLIRDKFTNRSKGFAYVEMSNLEDVPKVLLLNGQVPEFQVFPIMVKASEAEKNFAAKKEAVIAAGDAGANPAMGGAAGGGGAGGMSASALSAASRIYCGNLHTNITEDDLRIVFQSFGEVLSVTINRDEMARSKGFGFIQFSNPQEANFALSKGNGLELAGNYLKLGPVNEHAFRGDKAGGFGGSFGGSFSGGGGGGGASGGWKLEDDDGAGLTMNSQSRSALMAKLAGNKELFPTPGLGGSGFPGGMNGAGSVASVPATAQRAEQAAAQVASAEIEGSESFCFVIKNMFDVNEERRSGDAEWFVEIQQDVEEECGSYGSVLHTYVEKDKPGGLVYVLFDGVAGAASAAAKLHGRWFNKRQISVRYLSSQEYVGMFPEARSAVQAAQQNNSH